MHANFNSRKHSNQYWQTAQSESESDRDSGDSHNGSVHSITKRFHNAAGLEVQTTGTHIYWKHSTIRKHGTDILGGYGVNKVFRHANFDLDQHVCATALAPAVA